MPSWSCTDAALITTAINAPRRRMLVFSSLLPYPLPPHVHSTRTPYCFLRRNLFLNRHSFFVAQVNWITWTLLTVLLASHDHGKKVRITSNLYAYRFIEMSGFRLSKHVLRCNMLRMCTNIQRALQSPPSALSKAALATSLRPVMSRSLRAAVSDEASVVTTFR